MIRLTGEDLRIEDVVSVARNNSKVEIDEKAIQRVRDYRKIVEKLIEKGKLIYGVNTGVGELANVALTRDQVKEFQKYLIYSHAAGGGERASEEDVRAAMLARINTLLRGFSGVRPVIIETMAKMLNRRVTPLVFSASVGASGDLAPLAQIALVMMGKGEAFFKGKLMSGKEAMRKAKIKPVEFEAKEGLAVINGSTLTAGIGALEVYDAKRFVKTSEIAAAMSLETLNAVMTAFDERIQKVRGYKGAIDCAENIRRITEGSEILSQEKERVQDAYSLRSTPQVIGAARDALEFSEKMIEIELNAAADNPLFFPNNEGECLTGANFQGTPLAFALELLDIAITTVCALSERRLNRILDPKLNNGLPPFLSREGGLFSGMMVAQYTAASLVCENRILCTPAVIGSIPVSGNQEDFVSMCTVTALKTKRILKNAYTILAVEFLAAAQGLDFREPLKPGRGTKAAYDVIRSYVEPLEEDRPLYKDIERVAKLVEKGRILEEVEKEIGELK